MNGYGKAWSHLAKKCWRNAAGGVVAATCLTGVLPSRDALAGQAARTARTAGMTNTDVIKLVSAGFSDDLIIARLSSTGVGRLDLTSDGLVRLKQAGVSERVIAVMLGGADPGSAASGAARAAGPSSPTTPPTVVPAPAPPFAGVEAGIHVVTDQTPTILEPTVFSGGKTGGVFMSGLTMGIKKMKWKAVVRSPRAQQRLNTPSPEFLFVFDREGPGLSNTGLMFGASSPNEFVLARMATTDTERQLVVGEYGAFSANEGTRSEDTIELTVKRLAPGRYSVTPRRPLEQGEYCFFYAGGMSAFMASGSGKLFDFGVDGR